MELFTLDGAQHSKNVTLIKGKPWHQFIRKCVRCYGSGIFGGYGTCFRCGGSGREYNLGRERLYTAEQLVKAQARAAAAKARREQKLADRKAAADAAFAQAGADANKLADKIGTQAAIEELQGQRQQHSCPAAIHTDRWVKMKLAHLYARAAAERQAAFEARKQAERDGSQHVGTVGERSDFVLTVGKVLSFTSNYGWPRVTTYINLCRDAAGNVVVYKGSNGWSEGETLTVKATVKEHGERDGVKQTIIQRPKVLA